jgi:hypothetical protein
MMSRREMALSVELLMAFLADDKIFYNNSHYFRIILFF